MRKFLKGFVMVIGVAAAILVATNASAQPWHGGYYQQPRPYYGYPYYGGGWRRDNGNAALIAGIAGLVVGAALANSSNGPPPAYGYSTPSYGYVPPSSPPDSAFYDSTGHLVVCHAYYNSVWQRWSPNCTRQ